MFIKQINFYNFDENIIYAYEGMEKCIVTLSFSGRSE